MSMSPALIAGAEADVCKAQDVASIGHGGYLRTIMGGSEEELDTEWGWRERARSPLIPSSALSGGLVGATGSVLAGLPIGLTLLMAVGFAVLVPGWLLLTLPPWPSWKKEGPTRVAVLIPAMLLVVFGLVIAYRVAT